MFFCEIKSVKMVAAETVKHKQPILCPKIKEFKNYKVNAIKNVGTSL